MTDLLDPTAALMEPARADDGFDVNLVVARIMAGRADGRLGEITAAVRHRAEAGHVRFAWQVSFDGLDVTEENLTIDEAAWCESRTKRPWALLNPLLSAFHLQAVIVAALIHRRGMEEAKALELLAKRPAQELMAGAGEYEVVSPPKDSGSTSL